MRSGVSKARRPGPGAKTRPAESTYQTRKDAHIQVGAGEAEDLVGYSDADISFIRGFQAAGAGRQPHIRAAGILVPVKKEGEGVGWPGSGARRVWNALSSRISALRDLWTIPFRSRGSFVQAQAAKAARKLALRNRSGV